MNHIIGSGADDQLPQISSDWTFYSLGAILILIGMAVFLIPLLAWSGAFSGHRMPWFILYTYNNGGFYFVTSPILLLISLIAFIIFFLRR